MYRPLKPETYAKMKKDHPEMDLHAVYGLWMGNIKAELEAEQMERDGRYCVALHHWDAIELVGNARIGPPVHHDEETLRRYIAEGVQGLYYNPHPISEIISKAGRDAELRN